MLINQTKSLSRTIGSFNRDAVRLFLFNSEMPSAQANIPFDPLDPLAVYENCVAMEEGVVSVSDLGAVVIKPNPEQAGFPFKGTGPDVAFEGQIFWHVPTKISTNKTTEDKAEFDILNFMSLDSSDDRTFVASSAYTTGDYFDFEFDYTAEVSGLALSPGTLTAQAEFKIQYWDGSAGTWVDHATHTLTDELEYRIDFAQVTTTKMRIEYTSEGTGKPAIKYMRFYSTQIEPVTNFDTANPVSWALMYFDLRTENMYNFAGTSTPFIWFPVGQPLAPNVATLSSIDIAPGTLPKLIHAEFIGDIIGDI